MRLFRTKGSDDDDAVDGSLGADGRMAFRGLDEGIGYSVWITSWEDDRCFFRDGLRASDDTRTDERGEFVFTGLPAGRYRVVASDDDAGRIAFRAEADVGAGGSVVLTLRRGKYPDGD